MKYGLQTTIDALIRDGDLVMSDGYRTKVSEHGTPGFRIIRVADIAEDSISVTSPDFVSEDYEKVIGPKIGREGDVLLTTKGTVGRVAVLPKLDERVVYSPQLCFFRVMNQERLIPRYLRFWLSSSEFKHQASHRINNTDMAPYLNLKDIRSLRITLPSDSEQRAIAEVLGALDDKIEANTRVASIAGRLAALSFREAARGLPSSASTFADIASVGGGGTPPTGVPEFWNGDVAWATPTDITALTGPYLESTARSITAEGLANCSSPLYPKNSIFMTSRATIGAFAIAQVPSAVNQGFIVVNPIDSRLRWWFFHEMEDRVDEFVSLANGATFLELSRGRFKQLRVRLSEPGWMLDFCRRVDSLHRVARQAFLENHSLATLRDALLPQLMSGKLRVRDAGKQLEAVV